MPPTTIDTNWEKFLRNVVNHVVTALPGIIKNGYKGEGLDLPARDSISLPQAIGFTLDDGVALCPLFYDQVSAAQMTLTGTMISGLSSLSSYADITFPVQDVKMELPLVFTDLPVSGKWSVTTQCQEQPESGDPPPPVSTTLSGSYVAHMNSVQLTLTVELDPKALSIVSAALTLSDKNSMWSSQPTVNDHDIVFDPGASDGQQSVLSAVLTTDTFKAKIRDPAKAALESPVMADEIKTVLNQMLAS